MAPSKILTDEFTEHYDSVLRRDGDMTIMCCRRLRAVSEDDDRIGEDLSAIATEFFRSDPAHAAMLRNMPPPDLRRFKDFLHRIFLCPKPPKPEPPKIPPNELPRVRFTGRISRDQGPSIEIREVGDAFEVEFIVRAGAGS